VAAGFAQRQVALDHPVTVCEPHVTF